MDKRVLRDGKKNTRLVRGVLSLPFPWQVALLTDIGLTIASPGRLFCIAIRKEGLIWIAHEKNNGGRPHLFVAVSRMRR